MAVCRDNFGYTYYCQSSGWYNWGRWVLLGVVIVVFILIFFLFSCISARRRRKIGRQPMYGTGWASAPFHSQPAYNPNYNNQQQAYNNNYNKPAGAPPQGGYYGQNQGYFGGQQTGVQAPSQTYQPPSGPPPGK